MLDGLTDAAHSHDGSGDDISGNRTGALPTDALDTFLADLMSWSQEISLPAVPMVDVCDEHSPQELGPAEETLSAVSDPVTEISLRPSATPSLDTATQAADQGAAMVQADAPETNTKEPELRQDIEPGPVRTYSVGDLLLFERLTGYRLVFQRQLWRSVDKDGNRSMAGDRLFTVLAEEAFQLAERQRRSGRAPHADLTVADISTALSAMRAIAAHLGERGMEATRRLEAVLMAALDKRAAA